MIGRDEWDDALGQAPELETAYPLQNLKPLAEAGVVDLIDGNEEIVPGLHARQTGGHTRGHLAYLIESDGQTAFFIGDVCADHAASASDVEPLLRHVSTDNPEGKAATVGRGRRRQLVGDLAARHSHTSRAVAAARQARLRSRRPSRTAVTLARWNERQVSKRRSEPRSARRPQREEARAQRIRVRDEEFVEHDDTTKSNRPQKALGRDGPRPTNHNNSLSRCSLCPRWLDLRFLATEGTEHKEEHASRIADCQRYEL